MSTVADPGLATGARRGWRVRLSAGWLGLTILLFIAGPCFVTLPWSVARYNQQRLGGVGEEAKRPPSWAEPLGTDGLGRSLLWRCLLGGAISLGIGASAALIAVAIGVTWGALAGYIGGRTDAALMRIVDILYGLPYVLLVVLVDIALKPGIEKLTQHFMPEDVAAGLADVVTLLVAIGGVSWLTMARVIRGQVLSLRAQPFVEAARALGLGPGRILRVHLLPNLIGPIVVYTTLTVPSAILQESFLSFLGIGVQPPLPSWGHLAAEGLPELYALGQKVVAATQPAMQAATPPVLAVAGAGAFGLRWWLVVWPCLLLGLTLMALNFLGDALRNRLDPKGRGR